MFHPSQCRDAPSTPPLTPYNDRFISNGSTEERKIYLLCVLCCDQRNEGTVTVWNIKDLPHSSNVGQVHNIFFASGLSANRFHDEGCAIVTGQHRVSFG